MLRGARAWIPALLASGCAPAPETVTDSSTEEAASAWTYEGADLDEPMNAEDLQAALQALVNRVRTINAQPVVDSYRGAMSHAYGECPTLVETSSDLTGDVDYWDGMCEGERDVWFKGPMTTWTYEDIDVADGQIDLVSTILEQNGFLYTGAGVRGQTDIFSVDTSIDFNCSCAAFWGQGVNSEGGSSFFSLVDGPSHWTGSEAEGTWLADGLRPGLWQSFEINTAEGFQMASIHGSITGYAERYDTAQFDLDLFRPLDHSSACYADLTVFTIEVRDAQTGQWASIDFRVETNGDACAATGEVEGTGEITLDLATVLDWTESPW